MINQALIKFISYYQMLVMFHGGWEDYGMTFNQPVLFDTSSVIDVRVLFLLVSLEMAAGSDYINLIIRWVLCLHMQSTSIRTCVISVDTIPIGNLSKDQLMLCLLGQRALTKKDQQVNGGHGVL